jgi:hypothetical protein
VVAEQSGNRFKFKEIAIAAVISAGLGSAMTVVTWQSGLLTTHNLLVQDKPSQQANTPMHRILPGVPYIEQDGDVTQLCVSNKAAWSLPPYTTTH